MRDLVEYKNVTEFINQIQQNRLEGVIKLLGDEAYLQQPEKLIERTKKPEITKARRLIALVARWRYNIAGSVIAKRLNLDESQVFAIIYSGFKMMQTDYNYRIEVQDLMEKLGC